MSSPIYHAQDIDPALVYAPPRVRDGRRPPQRFSGDVAMEELQRQLALDPEAVPEPPETERAAQAASQTARGLWPVVIRFIAVAAIAAVVAWGIVMIPSSKKSGAMVPAQEVAQLPPQPPGDGLPVEPAANRVKLVHVDFAAAAPMLNPETFVAPNTPATNDAAPSERPAAAAPSAPQPAAAPPDNAEIASLVKRGKEFLVNGDFASARLLLTRAAQAGSAEGALALGATYDPEVIKRLGAIGAAPDIAQARDWYQKAAQLGSPSAAQQAAKLTSAAQ